MDETRHIVDEWVKSLSRATSVPEEEMFAAMIETNVIAQLVKAARLDKKRSEANRRRRERRAGE